MATPAEFARLKGGAILFSEMTPAPEWERDFNDWYDSHHIPIRMAVPGFLSAQRYRTPENPNYLVVYELDSGDVLSTPAYTAVKNNPSETTRWMLANVRGFTRYLADETDVWVTPAARDKAFEAPFLYTVGFKVPADRADEFDRWYREEHVPLLMECTDWWMVRRFRVISGEPAPPTHLALHYLGNASALESDARARARATPWRAKLATETWFKGTYGLFAQRGGRFVSTGAATATPASP